MLDAKAALVGHMHMTTFPRGYPDSAASNVSTYLDVGNVSDWGLKRNDVSAPFQVEKVVSFSPDVDHAKQDGKAFRPPTL